jgi:hypothetical protein
MVHMRFGPGQMSVGAVLDIADGVGAYNSAA